MIQEPIRLRVQEGDALEVPCDALVLKYAQGFHGVDSSAAARLGLPLRENLVPPGGFRLIRAPSGGGIGARAVLFVGVDRLRDFRYKEIRQFASKALTSLAGEVPDASHVAFTLHGPGYGLDERECFLAEVAGLFDAFTSGDYPQHLTDVTFIERNGGRASRLAELLTAEVTGGLIDADPGRRSTKADSELRSVGYDSANKPVVFVAMPINDQTDDLFRYGIQRPVEDRHCLCERIDKSPGTGDLLDRIKTRIASSRLVICELTGSNPNVMLEIGYAWGKGIPTILLVAKRAVDALPFDVKGQTCVVYATIHDLEEQLANTLSSLLGDIGSSRH